MALNALVVAGFGLAGLTQWSVVMRIYLPSWLATVADVSYMAGGAAVLTGLLRRRSHVELAGLFLLGSAATVRTAITAAAVYEFGPSIYLGMMLFHLFLALGCAGRIHSIATGEHVVVVRNGNGGAS